MTTAELELRCHMPVTHRVMGLRLRPLTLGHVAMMRVFDVDPPRNPGDLGTAVVICATRQDRILKTINSRWMGLFLDVWRRLLGEWDFQAEMARFSSYIAWHTELPMISRTRETAASPQSAIPFDRMLRTILLSELHFTPESLNSVPYLDALWSFVSWAEMQDRIRVMDHTENDVDEAMASVDWDDVIKRGTDLFAKPENQ